MGMQQFKLDVAAAVVNQDNVSLAAMDTSRLLDLFNPGSSPTKATQPWPSASFFSWLAFYSCCQPFISSQVQTPARQHQPLRVSFAFSCSPAYSIVLQIGCSSHDPYEPCPWLLFAEVVLFCFDSVAISFAVVKMCCPLLHQKRNT